MPTVAYALCQWAPLIPLGQLHAGPSTYRYHCGLLPHIWMDDAQHFVSAYLDMNIVDIKVASCFIEL